MTNETMKIFNDNMPIIVICLSSLSILLLILVIVLFSKLGSLRSRYNAMMKGEQTGANFEHMLLDHIHATQQVADENARLKEEIDRISTLLNLALTRIGVVRFSAFADTGGDLSYAVAMLDQHNDGIIFSSIFGRDGSRSYAKPIINGKSEYKLSNEEEQALKEAQRRK